MAEQAILSENQKKLLALIGENKEISSNFYLTGGTALAEFYLKHRFSEDLDFFSQEEFGAEAIFVFLKGLQGKINIDKIDIQQGWEIESLIKQAKIKFDWHIDALQLGSQLLKAKEVKDYPRMIEVIDDKQWQDFFIEQAKKIKKDIIK